jgi:O-6-methylguanine DNA methyltransferase
MDRIDEVLRDYFDPLQVPSELAAALARRPSAGPALDAEATVARLRIEASARGVRRVSLVSGRGGLAGDRRNAERARRELVEYLAGHRTFFSVAIDLSGIPDFQADVLAAAARIPYGEVRSYAALAREVGHPRAARAVGNALGANPVPVIVPCHRIIRGDGTWGHYAFGPRMKTALLTLERRTPTLVGSSTTGIVCRHGCVHEQRIGESRRIVFASIADAKSVGYRPCHVCRPGP